jgi:hypothetical protein
VMNQVFGMAILPFDPARASSVFTGSGRGISPVPRFAATGGSALDAVAEIHDTVTEPVFLHQF